MPLRSSWANPKFSPFSMRFGVFADVSSPFFLGLPTRLLRASFMRDPVSSSKDLPTHETLEDETEEQGDYGKINQVGLVENVRAKALVIS